MCLTYETHLGAVIYHRALSSFQKKIAVQEGHRCVGDSHLRSGGMTMVAESESEL